VLVPQSVPDHKRTGGWALTWNREAIRNLLLGFPAWCLENANFPRPHSIVIASVAKQSRVGLKPLWIASLRSQ
jgi:hypothetical protein